MASSSASTPRFSSSPRSNSTAPSTPPNLQSSGAPGRKPPTVYSEATRLRWRPSYHLLPASGWLNDPCAPFYNQSTGLYHVSFQWNPNGPDWGNICWGSATSPDLVQWDFQSAPSLEPETKYDCEGVFTGCYLPARSKEDDGSDRVLTVAYTSINDLPIHHTLPHIRGSESLSLAQSLDNSKTWHKHPSNPVLRHEPDGLDVTGFRDPYVALWRAMSELLCLDPDETLFGVLSGGIRGVTPTAFLYAIEKDDPTAWKYVGPLANVGCNLKMSRWSGDLGRNWEVVNFVTLRDEADNDVEKTFLLMGTEGCLPTSEDPAADKPLARPARCQLWMSGSLQRSTCPATSPVRMKPTAVGHLDHGCFYAANSFHDPVSDKQIVWGWVTEEDLCDDLRQAQGWAGLLSLPRELRIQTLSHVVRARSSALEDITNIDLEKGQLVRNTGSQKQLWTVQTLASEPVQSVVEALRSSTGARRSMLGRNLLHALQQPGKVGFLKAQLQTSTWELSCSIKVSRTCRSVGFTLAHSANGSSNTTITFSPQDETITIRRPSLPGPGSDELINSEPERAPHTLFTMLDPGSGVEREEALDIRTWRDKSVLEVFINGRTAITTRIYGGEEQSGLTFFAGDADGTERSELTCATLWDGIGVY